MKGCFHFTSCRLLILRGFFGFGRLLLGVHNVGMKLPRNGLSNHRSLLRGVMLGVLPLLNALILASFDFFNNFISIHFEFKGTIV